MCGIAGIWKWDGSTVSEQEIIEFTDTISHRGPDGRGIWKNEEETLAFGHRRLATIDLSTSANQPMHYANQRYHIVFNGEIFNFIELRDELKSKGYSFTTDSDTEVILASYIEWGAEMCFKFNGMWALVIYDSQKKECFISRDRFGIKPFIFLLDNHQFAFSSEQRSFLSLSGYDASIDKESAACYLRTGFGVEATDRTMLKGIRKLKAGHCGWIRDKQLKVRQWWKTEEHLVEVPTNAEARAERFRELFYDAVALRMRADVSIGSSLSGGFDSTAIVCAIAETGRKHLGQRLPKDWQQTFVATFPGKSNDERPLAEQTVSYAGVKGHFFEVREEEALGQLDQVLRDFDDVYVGIPVAPWLIYREQRRNGIVVSLDGHGADELMGAYLTAEGAYLSNAPGLEHVKENANLLRQIHQLSGSNIGWKQDAKRMLNYHPDFSYARNQYTLAKQFKDKYFTSGSAGLMTKEGLDYHVEGFVMDMPEYPFDETTSNLYRMFHHDVLPTILRNFDRVSMAHGIEVRMPFMDWRLVSYVFSLQGSDKVSGGYTKRIAREAMKGRMPEMIRDSKVKIGFNAPMPEWFSTVLQPWINQLIAESKDNEMVDVAALKRQVQQHNQQGTWNWANTGQVWKYLHYLWFEHHYLNQ